MILADLRDYSYKSHAPLRPLLQGALPLQPSDQRCCIPNRFKPPLAQYRRKITRRELAQACQAGLLGATGRGQPQLRTVALQ